MNTKYAILVERLQKIWNSPNLVAIFATAGTKPPHTIKKGTIIFNQGDPLERLYFIKVGFIKLYDVSEEGRGTVSYLLGPGYTLGIRALAAADERAKHNAQALTDVLVITMSHKEYYQCLLDHPEILVDLLRSFIDRLDYMERKLEGLLLTDATARVAYFLADTAQRFCKKTEEKKIQLPLRLTHQLIADFVGAFRETVTVSFNKLIADNVITADHGTITVLNMAKLKKYALID